MYVHSRKGVRKIKLNSTELRTLAQAGDVLRDLATVQADEDRREHLGNLSTAVAEVASQYADETEAGRAAD